MNAQWDSQPTGHPTVPTPPFGLSEVRIVTQPLVTSSGQAAAGGKSCPPWFSQTLVSDRKLVSVLTVVEPPLEGFYAPVQLVRVLQAEVCSSIAIPQRHLLRRVIQLSGLETC